MILFSAPIGGMRSVRQGAQTELNELILFKKHFGDLDTPTGFATTDGYVSRDFFSAQAEETAMLQPLPLSTRIANSGIAPLHDVRSCFQDTPKRGSKPGAEEPDKIDDTTDYDTFNSPSKEAATMNDTGNENVGTVNQLVDAKPFGSDDVFATRKDLEIVRSNLCERIAWESKQLSEKISATREELSDKISAVSKEVSSLRQETSDKISALDKKIISKHDIYVAASIIFAGFCTVMGWFGWALYKIANKIGVVNL